MVIKINIILFDQIGIISVTPTTGLALNDIFTIKCENFIDEHTPLKYKFLYFRN